MAKKSKKNIEPLIVAIKPAYRNHPIIGGNNVVLADWEDKETIDKADIFLQSNILEQKRQKKLGHIYKFIRFSGKPYICAESAVFRKNCAEYPSPSAYYRFSWWSYFQDEGDYNISNCPSDRWDRIQKEQNIEIKDWRKPGDAILVLLQRPGDSSLKNLIARYGNYEKFLIATIKEIRKYTDRKIILRPHPNRIHSQLKIIKDSGIENYEISGNHQGSGLLHGGPGLYEDLNRAWAVVGFNSNALTESVCEGIPTFSMCPSSMAWPVSNKSLSRLEQPQMYDRSQWLNNLAYCQWNTKEIAEGLPWQHLKSLYPYDLVNPYCQNKLRI